MHLKDVIIKKLPSVNTKRVRYPDGSTSTMEEYCILAVEGEAMTDYLKKVIEDLKNSFISDQNRLGELILYMQQLIWINIEIPVDRPLERYDPFIQSTNILDRIKGKQPRKDADLLQEAVIELKYACEDIIEGRNY